MDDNILLLLENINNRLTQIENKLDELKKQQDTITNSSIKMDKHVDFIETVYENVKNPLNYITSRFNNYIGHNINSNNLNNINLEE